MASCHIIDISLHWPCWKHKSVCSSQSPLRNGEFDYFELICDLQFKLKSKCVICYAFIHYTFEWVSRDVTSWLESDPLLVMFQVIITFICGGHQFLQVHCKSWNWGFLVTKWPALTKSDICSLGQVIMSKHSQLFNGEGWIMKASSTSNCSI